MTTMLEDGTELAAPVVYNALPGRVVAPDGRTWDRDVRAVITDTDLFIYGERINSLGLRRPRVAQRVPFVAMRPDGLTWRLTDTDGQEWIVGKGAGCACGSPLRSMPAPLPASFPEDD